MNFRVTEVKSTPTVLQNKPTTNCNVQSIALQNKNKVLSTKTVNNHVNKVDIESGTSINKQTENNAKEQCSDGVKEIVNQVPSETWTDIVRRKRPTVVGNSNKIEQTKVKLKGVPKSCSLHVYRLTPDTKCEDVIDFLKTKLEVLSCVKLDSKQPHIYSSFRVDIYEESLDIALNPDIWPINAHVRRFFHVPHRVTNR